MIVSACESTPYGISTDVKRQDRFWIKSQPYSLADMLANDDSAGQFAGGTVYQAFLSATNYHRWHSPVAGTIVRAFVVEGTYYSEADSEGADAVEPMNSQSYLAHVAARAVILIEADDPVIGLMAFVAAGMSEVSSCLIGPKVTPGYHVGKGEELGCFQYGGSTHCLVFRPGAIAEFALAAIPQPHDPNAPPMLVRSKLAIASTSGLRRGRCPPLARCPSVPDLRGLGRHPDGRQVHPVDRRRQHPAAPVTVKRQRRRRRCPDRSVPAVGGRRPGWRRSRGILRSPPAVPPRPERPSRRRGKDELLH